jgi:hypothetical protein
MSAMATTANVLEGWFMRIGHRVAENRARFAGGQLD